MPVPGWLYSYQDPAVKNIVKTLLSKLSLVAWKREYKWVDEQYSGTIYSSLFQNAVMNVLNNFDLFAIYAAAGSMFDNEPIKSKRELRDVMENSLAITDDLKAEKVTKIVLKLFPVNHKIYDLILREANEELAEIEIIE